MHMGNIKTEVFQASNLQEICDPCATLCLIQAYHESLAGPCFLNPSDAPVRLAQEQQRPELSLKRCLAARDFEKNRWKNMGVSKNSGTPKWMVYNGKPPYHCGSVKKQWTT